MVQKQYQQKFVPGERLHYLDPFCVVTAPNINDRGGGSGEGKTGMVWRGWVWEVYDGVFYRIVSFLIPNPQHTVSLYTFIYQESVWSGRSGFFPSGISGDNWTNLTKPSEYSYSSVLQIIGQYRYQLSPWHIPLSDVVVSVTVLPGTGRLWCTVLKRNVIGEVAWGSVFRKMETVFYCEVAHPWVSNCFATMNFFRNIHTNYSLLALFFTTMNFYWITWMLHWICLERHDIQIRQKGWIWQKCRSPKIISYTEDQHTVKLIHIDRQVIR
jgi:hypothetical protein